MVISTGVHKEDQQISGDGEGRGEGVQVEECLLDGGKGNRLQVGGGETAWAVAAAAVIGHDFVCWWFVSYTKKHFEYLKYSREIAKTKCSF